jgi:hypothetical protein
MKYSSKWKNSFCVQENIKAKIIEDLAYISIRK